MRLILRELAVRRGERGLFRDLSLVVEPGEAVALVGANGAGKTTLLRAAAGLVRPDHGQVRYEADGAALERDDARARLHWIGWQDGLKTTRIAAEEIRFWTGWVGGSTADADRALAEMGLSPAAGLEVRRLSAGQRRRLALARLVAAPRTLWLLDEPFAPLDADWRGRFGEIMAEHLAGGGSVLAAVHDPLPVPAREVRL